MRAKTTLAERLVILATWIVVMGGMTGVPAAQAADGMWTATAPDGLWGTADNWLNRFVAGGAAATASFDTLDITADKTVHLDSPRTLGTLVFGDTNTSTAAGWVLDNNGTATNILTLNTACTITVNALGTGKNVTISASINSDGTITKDGTGELCLTGDVNVGTTAYDLVINGGTVKVNPPSGNGINANTITINSGGTLKIGGINKVQDTAEIAINSGGTLDWNDCSDSIGQFTGDGEITGGGRVFLHPKSAAGSAPFSGKFGGSLCVEISNAFTQDFTGPISNTGQPRINKGTLGVSSASSFGLINIGSGADTGTLKYLGTGEKCEIPMLLQGTTGGATFDQSGSGHWELAFGIRNDVEGDKTITLQGSTEGTGEISGVIGRVVSDDRKAGVLSVLKQGGGTWILSGDNIYNGTTTITDGTLLVNGLNTASGAVIVDGGTLGGTGGISGPVNIVSGGTLAAGDVNRLGTLTLADGLTFAPGAKNVARVTGAAGAQTNSVGVTGGSVTLDNAALVIDDTGLTGRAPSRPLVLIDNRTAGAINGTFNGLKEGAQVAGTSGLKWYISYVGGSGNDITISPLRRP